MLKEYELNFVTELKLIPLSPLNGCSKGQPFFYFLNFYCKRASRGMRTPGFEPERSGAQRRMNRRISNSGILNVERAPIEFFLLIEAYPSFSVTEGALFIPKNFLRTRILRDENPWVRCGAQRWGNRSSSTGLSRHFDLLARYIAE